VQSLSTEWPSVAPLAPASGGEPAVGVKAVESETLRRRGVSGSWSNIIWHAPESFLDNSKELEGLWVQGPEVSL
jgi:hypothetical protein